MFDLGAKILFLDKYVMTLSVSLLIYLSYSSALESPIRRTVLSVSLYIHDSSVIQDLFVDRLVERVDKLKEEIAMYEAQLTAQLEETKAAKEQLMEAYMEIEVCVV